MYPHLPLRSPPPQLFSRSYVNSNLTELPAPWARRVQAGALKVTACTLKATTLFKGLDIKKESRPPPIAQAVRQRIPRTILPTRIRRGARLPHLPPTFPPDYRTTRPPLRERHQATGRHHRQPQTRNLTICRRHNPSVPTWRREPRSGQPGHVDAGHSHARERHQKGTTPSSTGNVHAHPEA